MEQKKEFAGLINEGNPSRILRCMHKAAAGEKLTLAFLGGSITQGCLSSKPELCYAYRVYDWWKQAFPKCEMIYVNAGIGATTSHLGAARVEEDVLSYHPDFVIVEFSVNDEDENLHFQECYESLVRRILSAQDEPALLLVHNVRYDDGGNAEAIHLPIGKHYALPCISMKSSIYPRILSGEIKKESITSDDLHPNDHGHALVAEQITQYLEQQKKEALRSYQPEKKCTDYGNVQDTTEHKKFTIGQTGLLPAPLTQNSYEAAKRLRNGDITPVICDGFSEDKTPQTCVSDCFKLGWTAREKGDRICFNAAFSNLAVQYRKTVRKPAPVANLILDGDREHPYVLDANFDQDWGDCLYLQTITEHGEKKNHSVEIEIAQASPEDKECFYLVSLIIA